MLRRALLWASTSPFLAQRVPRWPFVRNAVRRFLPGETLDAALEAAAGLAEEGADTVLTLLGENVTGEGEARAVVARYQEALERVGALGLDADVSVKPTHLGLDLSPDLAAEGLDRLLRGAGERHVWLDMEASGYVDATLALFRRARRDHEGVGLCLQAYLRRTPDDLAALLPLAPRVRLVKGAYLEPAAVAHPKKRAVDAAYRSLSRTLLLERRSGRVPPPAIATHDASLHADVDRMARELGLGPDAYEVQMLYGIGTAARRRLLEQGRRVRVLISYGEAWYPWYVRRLAERPANLWFVVKQAVRA